MRQELEGLVDEMKTTNSDNDALITKLSTDLSQTSSKLEQEQIDRLKTEQSADYWQTSFTTIEKCYLEEKEKAGEEIRKNVEVAE
jgi:hypothetical protein